jgi:hypothetical protein
VITATHFLRLGRWCLFVPLVYSLPLTGEVRKTMDTLDPTARETTLAVMEWTDQFWDARAGFPCPHSRPPERGDHVNSCVKQRGIAEVLRRQF